LKKTSLNLIPAFVVNLGSRLKQLRAVPVQVEAAGGEALLVVFSHSPNLDPWYKYMRFPNDTLKMALLSLDGRLLWQRDMGAGVIPGIWFFPFFPFDLDRDGVEEIWIVNNPAPEKPFNSSLFQLEKLDPATGETVESHPWPHGDMPAYETMSHAYRFFIFGGRVHGEPVLVTAQGTYNSLHLQGWSRQEGLVQRWHIDIPPEAPGARGSHMTAIVDWNSDGVDEVFYGERCIELDGGKELFCADRDTYRGHSDVAQPVFDWQERIWRLYTLREKDIHVAPRVCCYDQEGRRLWGHLEQGHLHSGWVARMGPEQRHVGMAVPEGVKSPGVGAPRGAEEYFYDIATGRPYPQPVSLLSTRPVDMDGDGEHEFAGDNKLVTADGSVLAGFLGNVAMVGRFLPHPGEHLLTFDYDGVLRAYYAAGVKDSEAAIARYNHPFYQANRKLTGCGYNNRNLGGV